MEQETKPAAEVPKEVRYDSSGKKVLTQQRNKETASAILAINDKLDQLLGILSSTLPTRIGTEMRQAASGTGGEDLKRLIEILSKELPDRIKDDADHNVFQKAEMLSMVISTSFQHLSDAFKSYQETTLKALDGLTSTNEKNNETLLKINSSLQELRTIIAERNKPEIPAAKPAIPSAPAQKPEPKPSSFPSPPSTTILEKPEKKPAAASPFVVPEKPKTEPAPPAPAPEPQKEEKSDLPGWLQPKRNDESSSSPQTPGSPSGIS